jgi:hypothetical protein
MRRAPGFSAFSAAAPMRPSVSGVSGHMRADGRALLHHHDRAVFVELLQADGGGEAGWAGTDDDNAAIPLQHEIGFTARSVLSQL